MSRLSRKHVLLTLCVVAASTLLAGVAGNVGRRERQVAGFLDHLGEQHRESSDGAGHAVQLVLEMLDERARGIFEPVEVERLAGLARTRIGRELKLLDEDKFELCWIVDFPMYEYNEDDKKVDFSHNPFSMPQGGLEALETMDPLDILAYQYDIVCNGIELSSGAIRNHRPDVMRKAFAIAGYDESVLEERFGGMYRAFQYGAPPHGGCAAGIDRIVMLLADEQNIREVIMFPMNQRAEDLMMGAPSEPTNEQMRELRLRALPKDA